MEIEAQLVEATSLLHQQKYIEAEAILNQILATNPVQYSALFALFQLNYQQNNYKVAFDILAFGLQHYPESDLFLYWQGLLFSKANQWNNAFPLWRKCIDLNRQNERALFQLGRYHKQKEEYKIAEAYFRKALAIMPEEFSTLNNLANTIQALDQNEEARDLLIKALKINPNHAILHFNLANIYSKLGDHDESYISINKALEIDPNYADAYVLKGQIYWNKMRIPEAKNAFRKALEINPQHSEGAFKYATLLRADGEEDKALQIFQQLTKINPKNAKALSQIGSILQQKGGIKESTHFFKKAIEIEPKNAEFQFNLAQILDIQKEFGQALQHYELSASLLEKEPHVSFFHRQLLRLKMCDWADYEATTAEMMQRIDEYTTSESENFALPSLTLNYFSIPQAYHLKIAQKNAQLIVKSVEPWVNVFETFKKDNIPSENKKTKIRIGYVSPDFRDHAVGLMLKDLFAFHDKEAFDIYAYALTASGDEYYQHYKSTATVFRDISTLSVLESAKQIYIDKIDVLVDLAGNTTFSKPGIFALKPCAIQLHYMGYPDTMGADFLPFIMADDITISDEMATHYSEEIIKLPHFWFLSTLPISPKILTRADVGLPENAFVFACFNSTQKMSPDWFEACIEIVKKCPNSVFWIYNNDSEIVENNLKKIAQEHNLAVERLVFARSVQFDEHVARCGLADLFLDTFNYGAGLTAWAALSGGLPVLSMKGNTFLSRMTSSMLAAVDRQDLICNYKIEYIEKAVQYFKKSTIYKLEKINIEKNKHFLIHSAESAYLKLLNEK